MIAPVLFAALLASSPGTDWCAGLGPQLEQAEMALSDRRFDEADRMLSPLESSHGLCWRVLLDLARVRYEQRNYPRANTLSDLALVWAPDNIEVILFRVRMLQLQNQGPQVQELLEKACTLAPDNAEAHFQLGMVYDSNKRNRQAAGEFERVIALRPEDARAYDYLALNLEAMGDIEKAEQNFKKGLALNRGEFADGFLDYNYGSLLLKLNRLAESREHLDRAVASAPNVRAVWYERARLNLRMDDLKSARSDAERALALPDPAGYILDLQVYSLLVQIYTRLGEDELARKYIGLSETTKIELRARERR